MVGLSESVIYTTLSHTRMPLYRVKLSEAVVEKLIGLDEYQKKAVLEFLKLLEETSVPLGAKQLSRVKDHPGMLVAKLGDYRLVYHVDWDLKVIEVLDLLESEREA